MAMLVGAGKLFTALPEWTGAGAMVVGVSIDGTHTSEYRG